jgi:RNA polymerase subunit RPABC4/transcription elongation factor Spt4
MELGLIILCILLGLIPAAIAKGKGKSFGAWWLYGAALFIVALPHALIMAPDRGSVEAREAREEGRRKCPFCAELVKREATVCRFCGRDLPAAKLIPCRECDTHLVEGTPYCPTCRVPTPTEYKP